MIVIAMLISGGLAGCMALNIILGEAVNIEAISIGWYDDVEESKLKINQSLKPIWMLDICQYDLSMLNSLTHNPFLPYYFLGHLF
mgnify:CR=1 FL=1